MSQHDKVWCKPEQAEVSVPDILIAVGDGFSLLDLATLREPLGRVGCHYSGSVRHEVVALTKDVTSDSGITINLRVWDRSILPARWLFLLCSQTWESNPHVLDLLERAKLRGIAICGVGPAVFALGVAGLLDGRACAVHPALMQEFQQRFPHVRVIESAFHIDTVGQAIGGTANIDFMLQLLSEHVAGFDAMSLASNLCYRPLTAQNAPHVEARAKADPVIDAAFQLMRLNLHRPLKIGQISRSLDRSQRVLERLFRERLGISPARAYAWLRVQAAQSMLLHSDLSFDEIADAIGCGSRSQLRSLYRRFYGVPLPLRRSWTPLLHAGSQQPLAA